jgi:UPF0271 protein
MGDDSALLDIVTTADVACGFHAGDPAIMRHTVAGARSRGVAVGAHSGYADRTYADTFILTRAAGRTR